MIVCKMKTAFVICALVVIGVAACTGAQDAQKLVNGVPVGGEVALNSYNYYSYEIDEAAYYQQMSVLLAISQGQANIYAAFGYMPNATNYMWYDKSGSSLMIKISPTDPNFRKGSLNIAIFGATRSFYVVTPMSGHIVDSPLNGVSVVGSVLQNRYVYYSFQMNPFFATQDMQITLTGIAGDPDLYVAPNTKTARPSKNNFSWSSMGGVGMNEIIAIPAKDQTYATATTMYIAIYGLQAVNNFTLTVTVGSTAKITNGLAVEDSTDLNTCKYYTYSITPDRWNRTLEITLSFSFGQAFLGASFTITRPDAAHSTWADNSGSYRKITINPDSLKKGDLYIGVCGTSRTTYSLRAVSGEISTLCFAQPFPLTKLGVDQPQYAYVNLDSYTNGNGDLVVTAPGAMMFSSFVNVRPGPDNFMWVGKNSMAIPAKQLAAGSFYIGAWPLDGSSSNVVLKVSQSNPATPLTNGTKVNGQLVMGQVMYYTIDVAQFQNLEVVLNFGAGQAVLAVSTWNDRPITSCATPRWTDTSGSYRRVVIKATDTSFRPGPFTIAVIPSSTVSYTITATITPM